MPRLNVSSVDLTEDEIDWLKAICNLSGESLRAQLRQIIKGHLIRFKPQYLKQISYVARKYDLTFEETFARLVEAQPPFGEVVNLAPIVESEEITSFGCEVNKAKSNDILRVDSGKLLRQVNTLFSDETIDAHAFYQLGKRHAQEIGCPSIVNEDYRSRLQRQKAFDKTEVSALVR